MSHSALDGVKVLEFATMISGPYCAKLLGDLGADVIKVEPPEGDAARACGPFPGGTPDPELSPLFLYTNTSKRGVTLDLANDADREQFKSLVKWADVLVDNHAPQVLAELGLDWEALQALNPNLIYTSITPYGRTGPRADAPGDELTLIQASGFGFLLPTRSENIERAPVKPGGNPVGYHGGLCAAVATLGALLARDKCAGGTLIDISLQEALLAMVAPQVAGAHYHGSTYSRVPDRPPAMGRMQTSDGYVILNALDDHHFASLRELMGNPEWCADDAWLSMAYRANNVMDIASKIDDWVLEQRKDDIHHKAAQRRIPIGPMNTAEDVMNYQQYDARGYLTEVTHPKAGTHRYVGWPFQLPASPPKVSRPAPLLGEHSKEVFESLETTPAAPKQGIAIPAKRPLPLEGVRVLEFTWVWAGPYCGMLLAHLGAEVIKVESHNRPDLMRRSVIWPLPEPQPTVVPPNDAMSFNSVNMNKKSITIDMSKPEGLEIAKMLAANSDVVVNNMRPGALDKLGLGYDALKELRPDIIAAASSGRGTQGPESEYLGYAMIHHAIGGNAYITGYPDDHPCHTTGDVDLMNATGLALGILAALHHRQRTGEGQFVDYSQCEGVTSLIGDVMLGYEMTKDIPERMGNLHPTCAPHGIYKAWGVDRWIAIEAHTDEQFSALADIMGQPELAAAPRFVDAPSRKANEDTLNGIIESWTQQRDRDRVVRKLQKAGVAAAPCRDARDIYADPHLRERGAFVTVNHPAWGDLDFVGPPWKMDDFAVEARRAPFVGEHTDEVLKEVAGLSDDELARLRDADAVQ